MKERLENYSVLRKPNTRGVKRLWDWHCLVGSEVGKETNFCFNVIIYLEEKDAGPAKDIGGAVVSAGLQTIDRHGVYSEHNKVQTQWHEVFDGYILQQQSVGTVFILKVKYSVFPFKFQHLVPTAFVMWVLGLPRWSVWSFWPFSNTYSRWSIFSLVFSSLQINLWRSFSWKDICHCARRDLTRHLCVCVFSKSRQT